MSTGWHIPCYFTLNFGLQRLMNNKANILIIDDEVGPRESLKLILKPYYNVYTAERGTQAIEILDQIAVDLVTVDLKMPGLSGIKVLEKLKQRDRDIEAIIITGYGSMDTAIEGLRLGAFDYISKPFDVEQVLELVGRALERRNAKLRLIQIRSDFVANVSHELRTPITVVIGFVSLLLNQLMGQLTDQQLRALERVYNNSQELLDLIDNVLWLTSLNAGDLSIVGEDFDVDVMVQEIAKKYEKALRERGIQLSIQSPAEGIRIHTDSSKVARIYQNLFHNAVKFTSGGNITVNVRRSARQRMIELEIVDTGIGIPRDQLEAVFQPFRQVDGSLGRQYAGLGLGLTVARRLTDFLGGTLEIKSQEGVGTHVTLSLPHRSEVRKDGAPGMA